MTALFHRSFRFRVERGFRVEADPLITLRPKRGMRMHLQPRALANRRPSADDAGRSQNEIQAR